MSKLLVTGAAGFVGKRLCTELRHRGIDYVAAVRRFGIEVGQVAVGDVSGVTDWSMPLSGCDTIIHLAARVHVMRDVSTDPLMDFRAVNVDATLNLARQAAQNGIRRFVFVSSVKVNGEETHTQPFRSYDTPAPLDPYGVSKCEAEQGLLALSRETGLEVVIVRPPLVYGPGVGANFLRLMQIVKIGLPLPFGAVKNRRSMVAVDNLVHLLMVCCHHPDAAGKIFMVSDDHDVSLPALLSMISQAMKKNLILLPVPVGLISGTAVLLGKQAVANRLLGSLCVNIDDTRSVLGWQPPIPMQEAIANTVADFLSYK